MAQKGTIEILREEYENIRELVLKKYIATPGKFRREDLTADENKPSYADLHETMKKRIDWLVTNRGLQEIQDATGLSQDKAQLITDLTGTTRALRTLFYDLGSQDAKKASFRKNRNLINGYYLFFSGKVRDEYMKDKTSYNSDPEQPSVHWFASQKEAAFNNYRDQKLKEIILKYVNKDHLQFVGVFRSSEYLEKGQIGIMILAEILSSEKVKKFLFGRTPKQKLDDLFQVCPLVDMEIRSIDEVVKRTLHQGDLKRTILDVEQGGFIHYRIMGSAYLVGANLDQRTMPDCELAMQNLFEELLSYYGFGIGNQYGNLCDSCGKERSSIDSDPDIQ
jgi:hypothetical protein